MQYRHLLVPHHFGINRMILLPPPTSITTLWTEAVHNLSRLEVVVAIGYYRLRKRGVSLTRS